jgi:dTDP-4-amino-4,6-dideoxygalactose transaminase
MRIGRVVPPAAAPLGAIDLLYGVKGLFSPARALRRLEAGIRAYFGVRHVFLVSSGTAALTLTLRAVRRLSSPTDRLDVLIPAFTCFSVPAAVRHAGLRPTLCDIDAETFGFDFGLLEQAMTETTLCAVAHHLFGIPTDVDRVKAVCQPRGILVVEDAAQALGVWSNGRPVGTTGDVGVFSFGRGKNVTCGSGGLIVTNSDRVAASIRELYDRLPEPPLRVVLAQFVQIALLALFVRPAFYWLAAAMPFLRLGETIYPAHVAIARLSGMKAGILHRWRSLVSTANAQRSDTAAEFERRFARAADGKRQRGGDLHRNGSRRAYVRLPLLAASREERDRLCRRSRERGLGLSAGYPSPVSEIPELRALFAGTRFRVARDVADRLLTVPTHHWLSARDKEAIADCVRAAAGPVKSPEQQRKAS